MASSFDWVFCQDITSEGWRDDVSTTMREMREFMRDPAVRRSVRDILSRDLGTKVEIDEIIETRHLTPIQTYYAIKSQGDIIFDGDEAALVLMSVMENGHVPLHQLENYRKIFHPS